jgi:hypothetical protein
MLARLGAAGALLVCLIAGPALAEVRTDVRYVTYPVRGVTIAEIWRVRLSDAPYDPYSPDGIRDLDELGKRLLGPSRLYKTIEIRASDGKPLAMKIRELAS